MESSGHESSAGPTTLTYTSPHPIYSLAFSPTPGRPRLAMGSFIEGLPNRIDILTFPSSGAASPSVSIDHPYPPTKLMFHPTPLPNDPHPLLASSGDSLRIFHPSDSSSAPLRSLLTNSKSSDFAAPLTSFDWNPHHPRRIATSSIDTTCTIWDLDRSSIETQLIAHDKEVYDIAWGETSIFASVSADASLRIFDLRDKDHSTIVYESPTPDTPLLRLAWNKSDLRYIATLLMDSNKVIVLDIRSPAMPVAELGRHRAAVNAVAWAPQAPRHLCSAGDDGKALIWELPAAAVAQPVPLDNVDPVLEYAAGAEINQVQWSAAQPDWIGIAFSNKVQLLKV